MKSYLKNVILIVLLVILLISVVLPITNVSAASEYRKKMGELIEQQNTATGEWADTSSASSKVSNVVNAILVIVRIAGMCVAVTMLLVVAMKYMMAAPGEKADIKKSSTAYVIGALVLFGAVGLLGIINEFSKNITATPEK